MLFLRERTPCDTLLGHQMPPRTTARRADHLDCQRRPKLQPTPEEDTVYVVVSSCESLCNAICFLRYQSTRIDILAGLYVSSAGET